MIHCRNCKYAKQLVDPYTKKNMDAFCCDLLLETLSMMGQAIKIYYDNIRVLGSFGCILGKKKAASQSVSPRFSKSTGWRCRVTCQDCGTSLRSDGVCPNCHEETIIMEQAYEYCDDDFSFSDGFAQKVREQKEPIRKNLKRINNDMEE